MMRRSSLAAGTAFEKRRSDIFAEWSKGTIRWCVDFEKQIKFDESGNVPVTGDN